MFIELKLSKVKIIIFILVASMAINLTSQITANEGLETQLEQVQDEFVSDKPASSLIDDNQVKEMTESEIIDHINKPGNEQLLERIKNLGPTSKESIIDEFDIGEIKEGKEVKDNDGMDQAQTDSELSEEEEMRLKISSDKNEMLFEDRYAYYKSIKEFYGYDIFLKSSFDPNPALAALTNPNYVIGPGDIIQIILWGDTQLREQVLVNKEGMMYIPNVELISAHGYTVTELEKKLRKVLARHYNTINPSNGRPTTFVDISLGKLKSIQVFINGEVVNPGSHLLSPHSTIFSALYEAKGVTAKGSLRDIKVIRRGKVIKTFDLYDYLLTGKNVNDITIKDNDNIFVSTRKSTITLQGEILKPFKYELIEGENLADIIMFSGGLVTTASTEKIQIERITPFKDRKKGPVFSTLIDVDFTIKRNDKIFVNPFKLYDHDVITVYPIKRILTDYVAITGAVFNRGRYSFESGMKISDLVKKTGGLLADAYFDKIELVRNFPDKTSEYISLNLHKDMGFELNTLDSINIYSKWNLQSQNVVIISGYIKRPGFHFLSDSTRVSDLIFSRGGLQDKWRKDRTYMLRAEMTRFNDDGLSTRIIHIDLNKVLSGDKSEDILLKDGDKIRIYNINVIHKYPKVSISGFVKREGEYKLSENMTVEDIVLMASGFMEGAFEYEAEIFRMNTEAQKEDFLSSVFRIKLDKDFLKTNNFTKSSFYLKDKDHVVIRRNPYFQELRKVHLNGEVKFPGVYTLIEKDETVSMLAKRAGGLSSEAFIQGLEFKRDTVRIVSDFKAVLEGREKYDIVLKNGDKIFIPKHPGTVSVEGYVYTPGLIKFRKDWNLDDYIEAAGGEIHNNEYEPGKPVIYYPGGNAKVDNGWFFSPSVKEGSRIVISKSKKNPEFDWRLEIRNWVGVATSTLTLVLLISTLSN